MIRKSKSHLRSSKTQIEEHPFWLDNDLEELLMSPTEEQLTKILGPKQAHSFLHPAMKDKPRKPLDPSISKQAGNMGAQELWTCLRQRSTSKIESKGLQATADFKDLAERYDAKQFHGKVLNYSRHRLELMKKMATINKSKSLELMQAMNSPPNAKHTCQELVECMQGKSNEIEKFQKTNSIDNYSICLGERYNNLIFLPENPVSYYSRRNNLLKMNDIQAINGGSITESTNHGTVTQERKIIVLSSDRQTYEPLTKSAMYTGRSAIVKTIDNNNSPFLHGKQQTWKVI